MEEETFADYILSEKDWGKKLEIMYYLKKRANIFYDNTVIFKTLITRMFLDYLRANEPNVNVDDNVLDRPERIGFKADEALVLLQYRNLKDKKNQLIDQFVNFVNTLQRIDV